MGLYIPNIEMPKPKLADTVYDAYIIVSPNGHAAIVVDNEDGMDSTEYPLVPVPRHGRLGDLDTLQKQIDIARNYGMIGKTAHYKLQKLIKEAPTIIPAEEGET